MSVVHDAVFKVIPKLAAAEQVVVGEPRLRVLHQVFILASCR